MIKADSRCVRRWGAMLLLLVSALITPTHAVPAPRQPVEFSHQVHVKRMTCIFCHRLYETQEVAGRPEVFRCMLCHRAEVTPDPEAKKLRALAEQHRPLAWVRLTRVPPFVRFSHQRHVAIGKVDCVACHGEIAQTTAPPAAPLISISMQFCLDCHRSPKLQLSAESVQALNGQDLQQRLLRAASELQHKRFGSSAALLESLSQQTGGPLSERERQAVSREIHPAAPVTTDCFACHR